MASSVCLYGHVLRRGQSCLEKGIRFFLCSTKEREAKGNMNEAGLRKKV